MDGSLRASSSLGSSSSSLALGRHFKARPFPKCTANAARTLQCALSSPSTARSTPRRGAASLRPPSRRASSSSVAPRAFLWDALAGIGLGGARLTYVSDVADIDPQAVCDLLAEANEEAPRDPHRMSLAMRHSFAVEAAYMGTRLVGFGRVISDGAFAALIVDLAVSPSLQRQGIGRRILQRLVSQTRKSNGPETFAAFPRPKERIFWWKQDFRWSSKYVVMGYRRPPPPPREQEEEEEGRGLASVGSTFGDAMSDWGGDASLGSTSASSAAQEARIGWGGIESDEIQISFRPGRAGARPTLSLETAEAQGGRRNPSPSPMLPRPPSPRLLAAMRREMEESGVDGIGAQQH